MASFTSPGDGTEIIVAAAKSRLRFQFEAIELRVIAGSDAGLEISLGLPNVRIGTAPDNDVVLTDRAVSRRHAEILMTPNGLLLRDLGSTNGTYVNGTLVAEQPLRDGAVVTIGSTNLTFRSAP